MAEDEFAYWGNEEARQNDGEFAYWGNENTEDVEQGLMVSEQIAELQARVEEQGALIEQQGALITELSENVTYKAGATKPAATKISMTPTTVKGSAKQVKVKPLSTRGITRVMRAPSMKPEAIAKMAIRMGVKPALKELGITVPYIGLIIAVAFQAYEGIIREIAHQAALAAIKEHEKESERRTKELFGDLIKKIENARRESYRSVNP